MHVQHALIVGILIFTKYYLLKIITSYPGPEGTCTNNNYVYKEKSLAGSFLCSKIVEEFLNKVKFKNNYIFGIVTYGLYAGAATRPLLEIWKKNEIEFSYIRVMLDLLIKMLP